MRCALPGPDAAGEARIQRQRPGPCQAGGGAGLERAGARLVADGGARRGQILLGHVQHSAAARGVHRLRQRRHEALQLACAAPARASARRGALRRSARRLPDLASMILGRFAGLSQGRIKRFLAYSLNGGGRARPRERLAHDGGPGAARQRGRLEQRGHQAQQRPARVAAAHDAHRQGLLRPPPCPHSGGRAGSDQRAPAVRRAPAGPGRRRARRRPLRCTARGRPWRGRPYSAAARACPGNPCPLPGRQRAARPAQRPAGGPGWWRASRAASHAVWRGTAPHLGAPKEPGGDGRMHLRLPYAGYPRRAGVLQARRGELQAMALVQCRSGPASDMHAAAKRGSAHQRQLLPQPLLVQRAEARRLHWQVSRGRRKGLTRACMSQTPAACCHCSYACASSSCRLHAATAHEGGSCAAVRPGMSEQASSRGVWPPM